jgi:hypothetical protein
MSGTLCRPGNFPFCYELTAVVDKLVDRKATLKKGAAHKLASYRHVVQEGSWCALRLTIQVIGHKTPARRHRK